MKKDILETFISHNKAAFDHKDAPSNVWQEIDKMLEKKNSDRFDFWKISKIAAAVAILIFVGAAGGLYIDHQIQDRNFTANSPAIQEFQETEQFYQRQVNFYWEELNKNTVNQPIEDDLNELDAVYMELKSELLKANYSNEETIINAMIQNYQTKLEILQKVLTKLNNQKLLEQTNTSNDEKINI